MRHNRNNNDVDYSKLSSPGYVKNSLLIASLYITAFEMLKETVIEELKKFYLDSIIPELTFNPDLTEAEFLRKYPDNKEQYEWRKNVYEKEVGVSLDRRDPYGYQGSCEWLERQGAITQSDLEDLLRIKNHRNEIAHELPYILTIKNKEIDIQLFGKMGILIRKIEAFWVKNDISFDLETMEEVDTDDLDYEDIQTGKGLIMSYIVNSAFDFTSDEDNNVKTSKN